MDGVATAMGDIAIADATPMASAARVVIRPRDIVGPFWIEVWVASYRSRHYFMDCEQVRIALKSIALILSTRQFLNF